MPKEAKNSSKTAKARTRPYPQAQAESPEVAVPDAATTSDTVHDDSAFFSSNENSCLSTSEEEPSYTHPRCYENDHIEKLETFAGDLDRALKGSFPPKAHPYPYTSVHVLLLRWMDDDLQVQPEVTKLKDVFAEQFSFQVEEWQIPSIDPTRTLQTKLYNFQNAHQSEKELLIVYYGGHSEADPRRGRSLWRANRQPNSPSLNWSSLQHLLETAVPYVLIILDCCFAANAARDTAEGTTKEILAACGRESPTLGVCERSFTSVLVEELQAFGQLPFTVAMLHSRLVTMRWRLAFTPIYALLSEHGGNSIAIAPIPRNSVHLVPDSVRPAKPSFELDADDKVELDGTSNTINDLPRPLTPQLQSPGTRVLLSISIAQEAELDLTQWAAWLTTAVPWDIMKIDVQLHSIFKSHSSLVLVSVPISGWNLLPERPAYRFVGFIRSQNLLKQIEDSSGLGVKTRSQSKRLGLAHDISDATGIQPEFFKLRRDHEIAGASKTPTSKLAPVASDVVEHAQEPRTGFESSQSWSPENDKTLTRARQQGLSWQPIASQYFPNKSANACRKRHERLMGKSIGADTWDGAKTEDLARAYSDVHEQMWKVLADRVGSEKWQTIEAKCMDKGLKCLLTAGQTTLRRERDQYGGSDAEYDELPDSGSPVVRHDGSRPKHDDVDDGFDDSALGSWVSEFREETPYVAPAMRSGPSGSSSRILHLAKSSRHRPNSE